MRLPLIAMSVLLSLVSSVASLDCTNILGYDLSPMQNITEDLTLTMQDGAQEWTFYIRPCGIVTTEICTNHTNTNTSTVCKTERWNYEGNSGPINNVVNSGIWNLTEAVTWYSYWGLNIALQTGQPDYDIQNAPAVVTFMFVCNESVPIASLQEVGANGPIIQVKIQTSLVCGPGDHDKYVSPPQQPISTLTDCIEYLGGGNDTYDGQLCPRVENGTGWQPVDMPYGTFLGDQEQRQFRFPMYGEDQAGYLWRDGTMVFNTSRVTDEYWWLDRIALLDEPLYGRAAIDVPVVAVFNTQMLQYSWARWPEPIEASTQYFEYGWYGQRVFVMRTSNQRYYDIRSWFSPVLTYDTILYENNTDVVEIRYYQIAAFDGANVTIGMQGRDVESTTRVWTSKPMTNEFANQLQGATLRFTRTPPNATKCVYKGIDFGSFITNDIQYIDEATNTTYIINPCGQITSNALCSAKPRYASVCALGWNGTDETAIAVARPTRMYLGWQLSPAPLLGLRSTFTSGEVCRASGSPRVLTIDWICDRDAVNPSLLSINQTSSCEHNIVISSQTVCRSSMLCQLNYWDQPNVNICPAIVTPMEQSTPYIVLEDLSDVSMQVALPFNVSMDGIGYSSVYVNSNGVITIGQSALSLEAVDLNDVTSPYSLVLAPFMSSLTLSHDGNISVSMETINGTLTMLARYHVYYAADPAAGSIDFDVMLSVADEANGTLCATTIQVIYYNVPYSSNANCTIGWLSSYVSDDNEDDDNWGFFSTEDSESEGDEGEGEGDESDNEWSVPMGQDGLQTYMNNEPMSLYTSRLLHGAVWTMRFVFPYAEVAQTDDSSTGSNGSIESSTATAQPIEDSSSSATQPNEQSSSSATPPIEQCYAENWIGQTLEEYASSLPEGSSQINFVISGAPVPLPRNFDVAFANDIALNIAFMLSMDDVSVDGLTLFVDVTDAIASCDVGTSSRRRILSLTPNSLVLSSFIFGNVTSAFPQLAQVLNLTGPSTVADHLAVMLQEYVAAGRFVAQSSQVNITGSTVEPISTHDSDDSPSSSLSGGQIAGIVVGTVVGALLLLLALVHFVCIRASRGSTDGAGQVAHATHDMEMGQSKDEFWAAGV